MTFDERVVLRREVSLRRPDFQDSVRTPEWLLALRCWRAQRGDLSSLDHLELAVWTGRNFFLSKEAGPCEHLFELNCVKRARPDQTAHQQVRMLRRPDFQDAVRTPEWLLVTPQPLGMLPHVG